MEDLDLMGRLVYITHHTDVWLRDINPKFNIYMVNRIAKIVKVFDWKSEEGLLLLEEREKTHGPFDRFAKICQEFKETLRKYDEKLSNEQCEALEMICHKMARILNGNPSYNDHWLDIAGYATLCVDDKKLNDKVLVQIG